MTKSMTTIVVASMLVAMMFFPAMTGVAQGADPAIIRQELTKDRGIPNPEHPKYYDALTITFTIEVYEAGNYYITGILLYNGVTPLGTPDSGLHYLEVGTHQLTVTFGSETLYSNSGNGYFVYDYSFRFEGDIFNESIYTTQTYYKVNWNHPDNYPVSPPEAIPSATKNSDYVTFKNDIITLNFYYKEALFEWYYSKDNKSMTRYYCKYLAIHGYPWQGGSWFTPQKSAFRGLFEERNTTQAGGAPTVTNDKTIGKNVNWTVTYLDIPIRDLGSNKVERLADVTITILLAAVDREIGIGNEEYTIKGGSQIKIDLEIEINQPLGVNGIALEHEMWSKSTKGYYHDFRLQDARVGRTIIKREDTSDALYEFLPGFQEPQQIEFLPKYAKPRDIAEGTYFWISQAEVDGVSGQSPMTYVYMPESKHLKLYLAFTTSGTSITNIRADPGIGVTDGGNPSLRTFIPPEGEAPPSILVTIAGWASAVCLVILPLWIDFRRAKRKLKELEEEYGEEL